MPSRRRSSDRALDEPESRWGGPPTILALVLLGAAAMRLAAVDATGTAAELPYVRRAWAMANGAGVDPHPFFDQPSLLLYLLAPFQAWQDDPSYYAARVVAVAIGVAGVAAAWWLGTRAYDVVAGGVGAVATAVATVHVAHSRLAVADILLATLVTVALALLVSGRVELAGLVAGFAAAAKYPGLLLVVPVAVVAWRHWQRLAFACALLAVGFALASPFALVHVTEAAGDAWGGLASAWSDDAGFERDHPAPVAFADRIWESLGPAAVIGVVGLVVALVQRSRTDRALAAWVLAYFAALLPLAAHPHRYVLPLVPALAVLAGRFRSLAPVTLLLLVIPMTWSVRETRDAREQEAAVTQPVARPLWLPSAR